MFTQPNELVDSLNKCLQEIKLQPFPHYPSFSNNFGYTFNWTDRIIRFPNGKVIKYHLTGPATVTNPRSESVLTAGLISGVGSFTAILTENPFITGAVVLASTALHRYGWTPYKQGKSPRDKITADYKALLNILPYFKKPAPNNQPLSPTATTPLLPAVPQGHPQSPTGESVPRVTVVEVKLEQIPDPKSEIFEEIDAAPGE